MMTMNILLIILHEISGLSVSYNQQKFCQQASWNQNAITFANASKIDKPYGIFIDNNNTVYTTATLIDKVFIWFDGQTEPSKIIYDHRSAPYGIFVTRRNEIYVDGGSYKKQVRRLIDDIGYNDTVMEVNGTCTGLFVDINDTIYCSLVYHHKVIKRLFDSNINESIIAAGNGSNISTPYTLNRPYGIFVDLQLKLYVADCYNNRIQVFQPGNLTGQTIFGHGSNSLNHPIAIFVSSDEDMFILECHGHRLQRVWFNSFYCIAGCINSYGSYSNQLLFPATFSFDTHGNLFIVDWGNFRIQKFFLNTNSCSKLDTRNQSNAFIPPDCKAKTPSGLPCKDLKSPCKMMNPCKIGYDCHDNYTEKHGYFCSHSSKFNYSVCKSNPCWNNGTCQESSDKDSKFICNCINGWEGSYCEKMINNCSTVQCENNAVCRPSLMNYTCECLGDNYYYGRHCEHTTIKLKIYKSVSKSFGYVGILALVIVVLFVVIMDVLKYGFGIDPVDEERKRIQREKQLKKRKPIIQRFVYVNAPVTTAETTV